MLGHMPLRPASAVGGLDSRRLGRESKVRICSTLIGAHRVGAGGSVTGELYDTDVFEWSQQQATLLRRRAAGELVNEAGLDWPNIAEEIESVGRSEVRAIGS